MNAGLDSEAVDVAAVAEELVPAVALAGGIRLGVDMQLVLERVPLVGPE